MSVSLETLEKLKNELKEVKDLGTPIKADLYSHLTEVFNRIMLHHPNDAYDKFEDIRSPAPVIDNRKCTLCDECLLVKPLANCIVETSAFSHSRQTGITDIQTVRPGRTSGLYYSTLLINNDQCIRCYACVDACPHKAISPANPAMPHVLKLIQL